MFSLAIWLNRISYSLQKTLNWNGLQVFERIELEFKIFLTYYCTALALVL